MANISERGIINRKEAEQLFERGTVTLPLKGGDIFVACRVIEGTHFPYHISGGHEQNRQMIEIIGSTGLTQADALNALPYRFRSGIVEIFKESKSE